MTAAAGAMATASIRWVSSNRRRRTLRGARARSRENRRCFHGRSVGAGGPGVDGPNGHRSGPDVTRRRRRDGRRWCSRRRRRYRGSGAGYGRGGLDDEDERPGVVVERDQAGGPARSRCTGPPARPEHRTRPGPGADVHRSALLAVDLEVRRLGRLSPSVAANASTRPWRCPRRTVARPLGRAHVGGEGQEALGPGQDEEAVGRDLRGPPFPRVKSTAGRRPAGA